jgi:hypothetical protein
MPLLSRSASAPSRAAPRRAACLHPCHAHSTQFDSRPLLFCSQPANWNRSVNSSAAEDERKPISLFIIPTHRPTGARLLWLRFSERNLGFALDRRVHPRHHAAPLPREYFGVGVHCVGVSVVEVGLEAMCSVDKFCHTFGAIKRRLVVQHLLSAAPIVSVGLVTRCASDSVHIPRRVADLNRARAAQALPVVSVRLPHEELVANMSDGIVNRRKLFVLHRHPFFAPVCRRHVEPVLDDLGSRGRLPLDQVVVGKHGAPALHRVGSSVLTVLQAGELARSGGGVEGASCEA